MSNDRPLRHDPNLGEVDPRSYHLLCWVRFSNTKVGSHERLLQASRLQRAIDSISTGNGEPKVRVHFTVDPEIDSKIKVEVRLQPLTIQPPKTNLFFALVGETLEKLPKSEDYELTFPA